MIKNKIHQKQHLYCTDRNCQQWKYSTSCHLQLVSNPPGCLSDLWVDRLIFSPDNKFLFAIAHGVTIKQLLLMDNQYMVIKEYTMKNDREIQDARFTPDGENLFVVGTGCLFEHFRFNANHTLLHKVDHNIGVWNSRDIQHIAFTSGSKEIITAQGGKLRIWKWDQEDSSITLVKEFHESQTFDPHNPVRSYYSLEIFGDLLLLINDCGHFYHISIPALRNLIAGSQVPGPTTDIPQLLKRFPYSDPGQIRRRIIIWDKPGQEKAIILKENPMSHTHELEIFCQRHKKHVRTIVGLGNVPKENLVISSDKNYLFFVQDTMSGHKTRSHVLHQFNLRRGCFVKKKFITDFDIPGAMTVEN